MSIYIKFRKDRGDNIWRLAGTPYMVNAREAAKDDQNIVVEIDDFALRTLREILEGEL